MKISRSKQFRLKPVPLLVTCGILLSGSSLFGAIIFDTITGAPATSSQPIGYYQITAQDEFYERYAERFTPAAGYNRVTDVTVKLLNFESSSVGTYYVSLYGENGGKPDNSAITPVGSGSIAALNSSGQNVSFPVSIPVTPLEHYWVVVSTDSTAPTHVVDWTYMNTKAYSSVGVDSFAFYNGSSWTTSTGDYHQQMQVSAVPEPAHFALAMAVGLTGFAAWRKRARHAPPTL